MSIHRSHALKILGFEIAKLKLDPGLRALRGRRSSPPNSSASIYCVSPTRLRIFESDLVSNLSFQPNKFGASMPEETPRTTHLEVEEDNVTTSTVLKPNSKVGSSASVFHGHTRYLEAGR